MLCFVVCCLVVCALGQSTVPLKLEQFVALKSVFQALGCRDNDGHCPAVLADRVCPPSDALKCVAGDVVGIVIDRNDTSPLPPLGGSLSKDLLQLTGLTQLGLTLQNIDGTLPSMEALQGSLAILSVAFNRFSGSLPASLALMTNLRFLSLRFNNLSGVVPDLSRLTGLRTLRLQGNTLGGPLLLPASPASGFECTMQDAEPNEANCFNCSQISVAACSARCTPRTTPCATPAPTPTPAPTTTPVFMTTEKNQTTTLVPAPTTAIGGTDTTQLLAPAASNLGPVLVGGVVGGVGALVVVVAVVASVVVRLRRRRHRQVHPAAPVANNANYGQLPHQNLYQVGQLETPD